MAMDGTENDAAVDRIADQVNMLQDGEAMINVTWNGQNGDMGPVLRDSPDDQVKEWVQEAVRTGGVPGIDADPAADFTDYVVDKVDTQAGPKLMVRPKVPFGGANV